MKRLVVFIIAFLFVVPFSIAQNNRQVLKKYKACLEKADLQEIQKAIDRGAPMSINETFFYAIKEFSDDEYYNVFKLLIKNGADIRGNYCKIDDCDSLVSPITAATCEDIQNSTATKILYEYLGDVAGSDLNGLSQKELLYKLFFQYGHIDQIKQLLEFCKSRVADDDENEEDVGGCISYIESNVKREVDSTFIGKTKDQIIDAIGVPVQQLKLTDTKESWVYKASKATPNNQKYSAGGFSIHVPYSALSFGHNSGTISGGYISDTIDKLTLLFENNIVVSAERELSTDKR